MVNVALANLDSYLAMGKNVYLYLNPSTGKLTWIPWDFDLSFGGHFLWGTPQQRINLSIDRSSDERLLTRLLTIRELKDRYHVLLREFMDKHFQVATIERQIDELASVIEPAVMEEKQRERTGSFKRSQGSGGTGRQGGWAIDVGLKQFVEGRVASVNEQLAGKSKGERPRFGVGR